MTTAAAAAALRYWQHPHPHPDLALRGVRSRCHLPSCLLPSWRALAWKCGFSRHVSQHCRKAHPWEFVLAKPRKECHRHLGKLVTRPEGLAPYSLSYLQEALDVIKESFQYKIVHAISLPPMG